MKNLAKKLFSITGSYDKRFKIINILGLEFSFNKLRISKADKNQYLTYLFNNQFDKSDFINESNDCYNNNSQVKLIAWYLPQFHDFEENRKWFGKGFTEWSNTSKTLPQFTGHWQPHIPVDVGYYNLETTHVMQRQIELAKKYGIYGFGFYYYWFSGKKIMEKPLQNFLADKTLDFPFFFFWANENWTKLWGSGEMEEVLFKQELLEDDDEKFMNDILPYMKDERYIKIDNKPILVIYHTEIYPYERYLRFINRINEIAKQNGFDGIYLMTPIRATMDKNNLNKYIEKYKLDALFEFMPMGCKDLFTRIPKKIMNSNFEGAVFDVADFVRNKKYFYKTDCKKLFKGCFPTWDNTPRKSLNGASIFQNSPRSFKIWLKDIIIWTKQKYKKNEQFVFINAWNEWAEGAHLEPDNKFGYAYLEVVKKALEES